MANAATAAAELCTRVILAVMVARAATDADADLIIPARAVAVAVMMTVAAALNSVATALVAIGDEASGVKPNMAIYTSCGLTGHKTSFGKSSCCGTSSNS